MQNIIDNNEISQIIFSKDEINSISSILKYIKNLIQSNISYSHINIYNNSLTRTNFLHINSEFSSIKNIPNLNLNSIEQESVNDYFKQNDDINEAINNIIIQNISQYAKVLNKSSHDSHELINNMTLDLESQMVNIAKSIKDYLMEILTTYQFRDAEKDILVSLLTLDFNLFVQLGVKVEGGVYVDVWIASASASIGIEVKYMLVDWELNSNLISLEENFLL